MISVSCGAGWGALASADLNPALGPDPGRGAAAMPDELHPRHLAVRIVQIAAVVGAVVVAVNTLPGLDDVRARLAGADPGWLVAVALAEVASCAGYVLVFRSTFCSQMSWRLAYDIAMAEQAANSLLPAGGAGGLALGVWALRRAGMPTIHIARRTVAFFVVTSAANFLCLVLVGVGTFVGIFPGRRSAALTLVPALITAVGVILAALSPALLRALGARAAKPGSGGWRSRARATLSGWLRTAADGVEQAVALLRSRSVGVVVGSFLYMACDIAALGFAFAAVAHVPAFGPLVLGYLIGQLGNLVPLPGGVGGTEGALIGVFVLYGVNLVAATAAVLAYRLFQLVVPALLGAPAFVVLRHRLRRAERPEEMCAPLALEVVELPSRG